MLLDEIAYLIDSNSTSRSLGTNLYKGFEHPQAPNTSTFIHETGGRAPMMMFSSSTPAYELPRVQIVDRSTDYQIARNAAEFHYKLLIGQANTTLIPSSSATGVKYLRIEPAQSPFYTGQDANERHRFSCNYDCWKNLST